MPIGTRVRLASGGPLVVANDLPNKECVTCAWPDGEADFRIVCLDVVRSFPQAL